MRTYLVERPNGDVDDVGADQVALHPTGSIEFDTIPDITTISPPMGLGPQAGKGGIPMKLARIYAAGQWVTVREKV